MPHAPSWAPIGGHLVRVDGDPAGRETARRHLQFVVDRAKVDALRLDGVYEVGGVVVVHWRDLVRVAIRRAPLACDGVLLVDLVAAHGPPLRIVPWTEIIGLPQTDDRVPALVALIRATREVELDGPTRGFLSGGLAEMLDDLATLSRHDNALVPGGPYR